jgi:hypothetical protein
MNPKQQTIKQEIQRLKNLHEKMVEDNALKIMMAKLVAPQSEMAKKVIDYYDALENHMKMKVRFWQSVMIERIPENMLDDLNETMDEWLRCGWDYLGMENIKADSQSAKDEFLFFKAMCENYKEKKNTSRQERRANARRQARR